MNIKRFFSLFPVFGLLFFLCFQQVRAESFVTLAQISPLPLASRLEIPILLSDLISKSEKNQLRIHLEVTNEFCGWTIASPKNVFLTNGKTKIFPEPFCVMETGNSGRHASGEEIVLKFNLPEDLLPSQSSEFSSETRKPNHDFMPPEGEAGKYQNSDTELWHLEFTSGIFSWETPQGEFALEVWCGEKFRIRSTVDSSNRVCRIQETGISDVNKAILELPDGERLEENRADFRFRFPLLPDGRNDFSVLLTLQKKNGAQLTEKVKITRRNEPLCVPQRDGEILVGSCFYPAVPDNELDTPEKKKVKNAEVSWEAPKIPNSRYCHEFVDDFIHEPWGNLAVFWPFTPGPSKNSEDVSLQYAQKLAKAGIYSMSIYQHISAEKARKMSEAAQNHFFLQNNIGEYASYLYQGPEAAEACRVPVGKDLNDCRRFFVEEYIAQGVKRYESSYPYVFSTSGTSLANYELEGGIRFICSELYAIGAQNLAWASSEMRGAARKWKPEYWGGWLAHEWQTTAVPYHAEQKFLLLRAGLLQQYLMGSSLMILESGTQTTQAGYFTKDSGKQNFGYEHAIPKRYRSEMKRFWDFVQTSPKRLGTPETKIALALGNCDSFVGLNLPGYPVWSQHQKAEKDPRWRYGDAQKTSVLIQNIFCPLASDALSPYPNHWLAGSPYGQTDIVGIDDLSRLEDLTRYSLLIYGGWNSMTPKIFCLLSDYVQLGGNLILAVPHLSTRLDCEAKDFTVNDLIHSGDLSGLIDVKIIGETEFLPEKKDKKLSSNERKRERVAKVKIMDQVSSPAQVLESVDQKPIILRQKRGKGNVFLFLGWEYPGKESLSPYYENLIRLEAEKQMKSIRVETLPGEEAFFSWAVYDDCVFILNLDANKTRTCLLHIGKTSHKLKIEPAGMTRIER